MPKLATGPKGPSAEAGRGLRGWRCPEPQGQPPGHHGQGRPHTPALHGEQRQVILHHRILNKCDTHASTTRDDLSQVAVPHPPPCAGAGGVRLQYPSPWSPSTGPVGCPPEIVPTLDAMVTRSAWVEPGPGSQALQHPYHPGPGGGVGGQAVGCAPRTWHSLEHGDEQVEQQDIGEEQVEAEQEDGQPLGEHGLLPRLVDLRALGLVGVRAVGAALVWSEVHAWVGMRGQVSPESQVESQGPSGNDLTGMDPHISG